VFELNIQLFVHAGNLSMFLSGFVKKEKRKYVYLPHKPLLSE
jgi:hypothetical protein